MQRIGRLRRWVGACGLATVALVADAAPGGAEADAGEAPLTEHVIVVGVPGLLWEDVRPETTPELAEVAHRGSVGTLSVRAAPSVTCPAEGWLTLGAGTYAAIEDPARIDPDEGCAVRAVPPVRERSRGAYVPAMSEIAELNGRLRFDATPGWLGDQLGCVAAVGEGAALAAATPTGSVAHYSPRLPDDFRGFAERCPATLVDVGELPTSATPSSRRAALGRVDALLKQVRADLPPDSVLIVVGVAETDASQARLHVAAALGPGFEGGWMDSSSTHRRPYVQLSDVAPTIASLVGQEFEDTVAGRPIAGEAPGRPPTLVDARAMLTDTDVRAVEHRRVLAPFFVGLATTTVVFAGMMVWLLWRQDKRHPHQPLHPALRISALGLACVPASTFLANALPWWRSSAPLAGLAGAVALGAAALLGLAVVAGAFVGPARRAHVQAVAVAALTVIIFAGDAVTGLGLQIDSLLGYNPLVAGRFTGFGNIAFSVLGAAAVALAALLAAGRSRRTAQIAVSTVAVPVLALDGLPQLGADFGGVLALVPAFSVLWLLVGRVPLTWARLVGAGLGGVVLVGAISWLDYMRPEESRTHFGRFAGSVASGAATDTIHRKLANSWELLLKGPHTLAGLVLAGVLAWVVLRPPPLLLKAYRTQPALQPLLKATLTLAAFGFALNDSGVAIPAVISLVTGPLVLALCAANPLPHVWDMTGQSSSRS